MLDTPYFLNWNYSFSEGFVWFVQFGNWESNLKLKKKVLSPLFEVGQQTGKEVGEDMQQMFAEPGF